MPADITPVSKVLPVSGDALIVQMREVASVPNEVVFQIHRNGNTETRFTITELRKVLVEASALLNGFAAKATVGGVR